MGDITFLERYLDKTGTPLSVEQERYGGEYLVLVLRRSSADFLFEMLESDDIDGPQTQFFLSEHGLFPAAKGRSFGQALRRLSAKLEAMYELTDQPGRFGVQRKFELLAECDAEPGEAMWPYEVQFEEVVEDLRCGCNRGLYWFEEAKETCSKTEKRNLHAWVNFEWTADLNEAITKAESLE